jgi:glycosyltransferase involved in cell wall biosynthesis
MSATGRRPVRLLTLTTLFPNALQPRRGIFIANRLARLRATGRVDCRIIAAIPSFPGAYRRAAGVPESEQIEGMDVRHPRYLHVPRVGMRMQPDSLAYALLEDLRAHGDDATRFDVVDAHYFYPDGVAAARVADNLQLPLVISARGSDINLIGETPFARRRMVEAAMQAEALIAVSSALARTMTSLGMPGERIHVLRNGVDPNVFSPVPMAEARARLGLHEGPDYVLGVGNLVNEKAFDVLVRAVAMMPGTRLVLVGEGPEQEALRSLAQDVAPGRVDFRPNMPQAELRFVYAAANVLGLPSLREGWPNVVLEAMACGLPVVAKRVGGVPEILLPDAPGMVVEDADQRNWSDALNATIRAKLLPDAVRSYALRFGWDEVVDAQCGLYERVARSSNRAALAVP